MWVVIAVQHSSAGRQLAIEALPLLAVLTGVAREEKKPDATPGGARDGGGGNGRGCSGRAALGSGGRCRQADLADRGTRGGIQIRAAPAGAAVGVPLASFGLARKVRMEDRLLDNTGHRIACVGATAGGSWQQRAPSSANWRRTLLLGCT